MNTILQKITEKILIDEEYNFKNYDHSKIVLKRRKKPIDILPFLKKNFCLITEVKKGSPSKGIIRHDFDPDDIAVAYENSGACAISVITEKNFFFGEKTHLTSIKKKVSIPVLRKDFIIHPYQVYESYNLGADFILLIAACLSEVRLKELYKLTLSLGMNALVEVHNEAELKTALKIRPEIIGINNRDLNTFKVDLDTSLRLKPKVPGNISVISESGIKTNKDILKLKSAGFAGALVGESLLKNNDLTKAVRSLLYG
jgi:indole-3-glycerol phosphate synthase